jgi:hypothetical protein
MTCSTTDATNILKEGLKKLDNDLKKVNSKDERDKNMKLYKDALKNLEDILDTYSDTTYKTELKVNRPKESKSSAEKLERENRLEENFKKANESYYIRVYDLLKELTKINNIREKKLYTYYLINSIIYVFILQGCNDGVALAKTILKYNYIKFIKFNKDLDKKNSKMAQIPFILDIWQDVKDAFEKTPDLFKPINDAITAYEEKLIKEMNERDSKDDKFEEVVKSFCERDGKDGKDSNCKYFSYDEYTKGIADDNVYVESKKGEMKLSTNHLSKLIKLITGDTLKDNNKKEAYYILSNSGNKEYISQLTSRGEFGLNIFTEGQLDVATSFVKKQSQSQSNKYIVDGNEINYSDIYYKNYHLCNYMCKYLYLRLIYKFYLVIENLKEAKEVIDKYKQYESQGEDMCIKILEKLTSSNAIKVNYKAGVKLLKIMYDSLNKIEYGTLTEYGSKSKTTIAEINKLVNEYTINKDKKESVYDVTKKSIEDGIKGGKNVGEIEDINKCNKCVTDIVAYIKGLKIDEDNHKIIDVAVKGYSETYSVDGKEKIISAIIDDAKKEIEKKITEAYSKIGEGKDALGEAVEADINVAKALVIANEGKEGKGEVHIEDVKKIDIFNKLIDDIGKICQVSDDKISKANKVLGDANKVLGDAKEVLEDAKMVEQNANTVKKDYDIILEYSNNKIIRDGALVFQLNMINEELKIVKRNVTSAIQSAEAAIAYLTQKINNTVLLDDLNESVAEAKNYVADANKNVIGANDKLDNEKQKIEGIKKNKEIAEIFNDLDRKAKKTEASLESAINADINVAKALVVAKDSMEASESPSATTEASLESAINADINVANALVVADASADSSATTGASLESAIKADINVAKALVVAKDRADSSATTEASLESAINADINVAKALVVADATEASSATTEASLESAINADINVANALVVADATEASSATTEASLESAINADINVAKALVVAKGSADATEASSATTEASLESAINADINVAKALVVADATEASSATTEASLESAINADINVAKALVVADATEASSATTGASLESAIKADINVAKALVVADATATTGASLEKYNPEQTLNASVGILTNIGKQLTISLPEAPRTPRAPSGAPLGASVTPSRTPGASVTSGAPGELGASGTPLGAQPLSSRSSSIDSSSSSRRSEETESVKDHENIVAKSLGESEGVTKSESKSVRRTTENREYDKYSDEALKDMYLYTDKYHDIDYNEFKDIRDYAVGLLNQPRRPDANNKIARLSSEIDTYNYNINGANGTNAANAEYETKNIIDKINRFESDPDNPIEALTIKFEDRLVFIITTFFIRFAVLAIIQRAIDISMIKTFYEGFIYYGCIYILLFWFFVFFINVDNNYDIAYLNVNVVANYIRSLFFYFYMGTNGISRLIIHSLLIMVIIVIPIILNIKNIKDGDNNKDKDITEDSTDGMEKIKLLSLEERTKLSKTLSLFTLFIWILTSIIASKF